MTREELINFGELFLEVNKDSKNSSTYEFIDAAVKLFEQEPILDKIRAEIEFEVDHRTNMLCAEDVFEIIDKYKESEE